MLRITNLNEYTDVRIVKLPTNAWAISLETPYMASLKKTFSGFAGLPSVAIEGVLYTEVLLIVKEGYQ